jgi:hypothetical protein
MKYWDYNGIITGCLTSTKWCRISQPSTVWWHGNDGIFCKNYGKIHGNHNRIWSILWIRGYKIYNLYNMYNQFNMTLDFGASNFIPKHPQFLGWQVSWGRTALGELKKSVHTVSRFISENLWGPQLSKCIGYTLGMQMGIPTCGRAPQLSLLVQQPH